MSSSLVESYKTNRVGRPRYFGLDNHGVCSPAVLGVAVQDKCRIGCGQPSQANGSAMLRLCSRLQFLFRLAMVTKPYSGLIAGSMASRWTRAPLMLLLRSLKVQGRRGLWQRDCSMINGSSGFSLCSCSRSVRVSGAECRVFVFTKKLMTSLCGSDR
jgi:hypothetical protein